MTEWIDVMPYADLLLVFALFFGVIVFTIANVNYLPNKEEKDEEETN